MSRRLPRVTSAYRIRQLLGEARVRIQVTLIRSRLQIEPHGRFVGHAQLPLVGRPRHPLHEITTSSQPRIARAIRSLIANRFYRPFAAPRAGRIELIVAPF